MEIPYPTARRVPGSNSGARVGACAATPARASVIVLPARLADQIGAVEVPTASAAATFPAAEAEIVMRSVGDLAVPRGITAPAPEPAVAVALPAWVPEVAELAGAAAVAAGAADSPRNMGKCELTRTRI